MLASKLVKMYRLCAEQLSPQVHYDFGLRSIKSVLTLAGNIHREFPYIDEELALIQALQKSNAPKFLPDDIPLFNNIMSDLFPGLDMRNPESEDLKSAVRKTLDEKGLLEVPSQMEKIMQLYDTLKVRHGIMLVGPTGGGKSTIYKTLAASLARLSTPMVVNVSVLNPKSLTINELYGVFDENTRDWTDGLVANLVRTSIEENTDSLRYIPCLRFLHSGGSCLMVLLMLFGLKI
jgi:dynein heavy chain